jgi:hypothetical protein
MIYHSWIGTFTFCLKLKVGTQIGGSYWRELMMDKIVWDEGYWPNIMTSTPSDSPQPVPQV